MRYELRSERALKLVVIGQNNLNCKPIKCSTTLPPKNVSIFYISLYEEQGEINLHIAVNEDEYFNKHRYSKKGASINYVDKQGEKGD